MFFQAAMQLSNQPHWMFREDGSQHSTEELILLFLKYWFWPGVKKTLQKEPVSLTSTCMHL